MCVCSQGVGGIEHSVPEYPRLFLDRVPERVWRSLASLAALTLQWGPARHRTAGQQRQTPGPQGGRARPSQGRREARSHSSKALKASKAVVSVWPGRSVPGTGKPCSALAAIYSNLSTLGPAAWPPSSVPSPGTLKGLKMQMAFPCMDSRACMRLQRAAARPLARPGDSLLTVFCLLFLSV